MSKAFDIGIECLSGAIVIQRDAHASANRFDPALRSENRGLSAAPGAKSFHIETFGCQMNTHDSEKVSGVLLSRGYRPVESADASRPRAL